MSGKFSRKNVLVGLAAAGVIGVGIAAPTIAMADASASPAPSSSADTGADNDRAGHRTEFAEALAKELGVPTEKVTAALEKVREQHKPAERPRDGDGADRQAALAERLKQAVTDGKLTQAQADAITKAAEAGVLNPGPGHGHGGGPRR